MGDSKDSATLDITKKACIQEDSVGSDQYKTNHMSLIFQEGLSFSGFERNKFFLGDGRGRFTDLSDLSGADSEMDCRAACLADFDNDGDLDLFVNSIQRKTHLLYRNDLSLRDRHFIKIVLHGTKGHADAIGATVTLLGKTKQTRVISGGSGFESQHALPLIFGVEDKKQTIQVRWPMGKIEHFSVSPERSAQANQTSFFVLKEGSGKATRHTEKSFKLAGTKKDVGLAIGKFSPKLSWSTKSKIPINMVNRDQRLTLINFWSTTCVPCLKELPDLEKLHAGGKYRIMLVDMDGLAHPRRRSELLTKLAPSLTHGSLDHGSLGRLFGTSQTPLPMSIILEANGRIRRIIRGVISLEDL